MSFGVHWEGVTSGPLVVFVHGLGGSHRTWDRVVPKLRDRYRLLLVDLPGGRSMAEEAADLERVLGEAGATGATVVGHSMGGLVGTALAERAPRLVGRLILIDTPPTYESRTTSRGVGAERLIRLPVVGRVLWSLITDAQRRAGLQSAFASGTEVPAAFLADLRATSHSAFAGSTVAVDRYVRERALTDRLADLAVPVDVVFGLRDQRVDPASLAGYGGLPNVTVTTLPTVGHTPPWEAPAAVIDAIERQPARAPVV